MTGALKDQTVLVIGRASGIAGAVVQAARADGANVIAAGRDAEKLAAAYRGTDVSTETVARRTGRSEDVAGAVLFCLTNSFLTGVTLKVDGGEVLV